VTNGGNEGRRHQRVYDDLRKKLLDLSRRNPMLNYKHRAGSRRQLRVVNTNLESAFAELAANQRELPFAAVPEPDGIPEDELTERFKAALGHAKSTDIDYLTRLAALDSVARQDDASLAKLERWLRDRIREQLELPARAGRHDFNLVEHARKKGIDPSYELSPARLKEPNIVRRLQSMFFADELDSRLARIAADARLSEQETGLSTLFLAFGFLRWYESNDSDTPNFAPLLLLPVQISKRLQGRRAVYSIKAASETPEINRSLRELLLRNSPDVSRHIPDFDEEGDGIESYFDKVRGATEGLDRWRVERNLTLGHFAFGRLAMYEDLSPDNWQESPIEHPLLGSLLRGSEIETAGRAFFASDYDLDDETIENAAPILINDADASQHSAIVDSMNGKNLVVEGPPGTGKSQTITNIIANALYAGQTVLFVADKLAALEVVKDRLDAAGLGDFCLELHSDKAHPKPIIESLRQRFDLTQHVGAEPNWREQLRRLRSARGRVREYLSALHERNDDDGHTPFDLIWAAIAKRRELTREFDAMRRVDLDRVFSKGVHEVECHADALKSYSQVVGEFGGRHGRFTDTAWSRSRVTVLTPDEPDLISDRIRDCHECARALAELIDTTELAIDLDFPRNPHVMKRWIDSIGRLPAIAEDEFLPKLGGFSSSEVEAATELAVERLELVTHPIAELPSDKIDALYQLAKQLEQMAMVRLVPAEIIASASRMERLRKPVIDGLDIFSRLITAFRASSASNISTARDIARAAKLVGSATPALDTLLWFDRIESESLLSEAAKRAIELLDRDRKLRARFRLQDKAKWPSLNYLRFVAEVYSASGLQRIGNRLTGKHRRATRIVEAMGGADVAARDLNEAIALVEDLHAFVADSSLSETTGSAWSRLSTPFEGLVAVLHLRRRFEAEFGRRSEFVEGVHRALFSSNRRVIDVLRRHGPWAEHLLAAIQEWPESLDLVPLTDAAAHINARVETFARLASEIKALGLAEVSASFSEILKEVDRQRRIAELEDLIVANPLLALLGEQAWRSEHACQSLRSSAEIAKGIASAGLEADVRARLLSDGTASFRRALESAASAIGRSLASYQETVDRLSRSLDLRDAPADRDPKSMANWLQPFVNELDSLREWLEVARRRCQLGSNGMDAFVDAFEGAQLPYDRLAKTFTALAFYHRATRARQRREVLRTMTSVDLENERARFVAADEALKQRQREAVRMKLLGAEIPAGSAIGPRRDWTDLQCLRNEFTKQRKHLPIRRLLSRSGKAVQVMKPCFMMSPLSLAKFLPARVIDFDLLVIDEASQMKPEDSLGGLLRAKRVVIVGDPNQLPPTDFFSRVTPADEGGADNDDEADDVDAESILDWSLKTFQTPRRLKWHYRSRCESLIAFSNREFYSSKPGSYGDLVTFPNAQPNSFSIDLVRVNGNYKASRNTAEVARIVEAAIDFMIEHADMADDEMPTLGIVAINIEQRDAIQEEFNRSARDEAIERYLNVCSKGTTKRGPEPFFIKNLENVQGDERDFIMISLTYGREPGQERVAQRFGPIARSQGHRRLNVLFTRARRRIVLFSSMGSEDVLVTPTSKNGVRVLRDYLRYVESRRLEVGTTTGRDFDSDFERDVLSRLEARGFVVDPQVGVAGYRIDLGVRHPDQPTLYLAGIECDGAAFHSAKSARDRDRLREAVLRGKGWSILRVWSTDWFANADLQTDRLVSELQRLAVRPAQPKSHWTAVREPAPPPSAASEDCEVASEEPASNAFISSSKIALPPLGEDRLTEIEIKNRLRALRDREIRRDFPEYDPERCILRDIMIEKIVDSKLDEPQDFALKIPLWLRERTDQRQLKYLGQICSIVRL
jgi:very-short-patch-repair endonuclease